MQFWRVNEGILLEAMWCWDASHEGEFRSGHGNITRFPCANLTIFARRSLKINEAHAYHFKTCCVRSFGEPMISWRTVHNDLFPFSVGLVLCSYSGNCSRLGTGQWDDAMRVNLGEENSGLLCEIIPSIVYYSTTYQRPHNLCKIYSCLGGLISRLHKHRCHG